MLERVVGKVRWIALAGLAGVLMVAARPVRAQEDEPAAAGRRAFAGMQRVAGEVTAVNGATVTIKTEEGQTMQIVTTENTRVMKGRGVTVKVADVKVGDGATAAGNLDAPNKTLHAAFLMVVDAAELKAMKADLGKTYILGKVTAIDLDNAKMTVERPDKVSQVIGFDDSTSFRRGRVGRGGMGGFGGGGGAASAGGAADAGESITLADVKVGDNVGGKGVVKDGMFVPTVLTVGTPGQGRRRGGEGAPAGAGPATGAAPAAGSGAGPQ